ncbi:uncharacterized protein LOC107615542 [Arachis ipaensis]|uniref:uncharacterized protein LOC107615542 n=1 Tax=Arachis ipaensis TaxID=130454 RepID=UPI000A2B73E7|nr:uncharacterized protein LOC107615542 [Arachis ipaensis]
MSYNFSLIPKETLAAIPPPHQHIQHLNPPFANQNTQPIRKRKKEGKKEGKRRRGPPRRRRGRGRKLSAPCHRVSSSPPCCFAVHEESPSLVNDKERESREKEWVALPSRRRRPPRAAAEPAEQEPIAAVRASITVREASMSVAVELISERKRVAGEREKCCATVPYCAATATPCRRQSCHRCVPPPLLTAEEKPCLRYCLPGQIHRLILPLPLACHFCSAVPLFAVLIVERKCC